MINFDYILDIPDNCSLDFIGGISTVSRFINGVYQLERRLTEDTSVTTNYLRLLNLYEITRRNWVYVRHKGVEITRLYPLTCSYVYKSDKMPSESYMRIHPNIDLYMVPCIKSTPDFIHGIRIFLEWLRICLPVLSLPNIYLDEDLIEPVIVKFPLFELPDDITAKIIRYCPTTCIRVNKYFYAMSLRYLLPLNPKDMIKTFIQAKMVNALSGVLRASPRTDKSIFLLALDSNNLEVSFYCLKRTNKKLDYLIYARNTRNIQLYEDIIKKLPRDMNLDPLGKICYQDSLLDILFVLQDNKRLSDKLIAELFVNLSRNGSNIGSKTTSMEP
jgi:hypothetical protein